MPKHHIGIRLQDGIPRMVRFADAPATVYDGQFFLGFPLGQRYLSRSVWHYVRPEPIDAAEPATLLSFCNRVLRAANAWLSKEDYLQKVVATEPRYRDLYLCGYCAHLVFRALAGVPAETMDITSYVASLQTQAAAFLHADGESTGPPRESDTV